MRNESQTDLTGIHALIADYRPTTVPESVWVGILEEVATLVLAAGPARKGRVRMDLHALGAVAGHLHGQGRPLALGDMLTDAMLLEFDQAVLRNRASGTRENVRGRLRRLQATFAGVPASRARRTPAERAVTLPPFDLVAQYAPLHVAAAVSDSIEATAWRECWAALTAHGALAFPDDLPAGLWEAAHRFARRQGVSVTKRRLRFVAVHQALAGHAPIAVVAPALGLTRRDLDLALAHPQATGVLDQDAMALLRGV